MSELELQYGGVRLIKDKGIWREYYYSLIFEPYDKIGDDHVHFCDSDELNEELQKIVKGNNTINDLEELKKRINLKIDWINNDLFKRIEMSCESVSVEVVANNRICLSFIGEYNLLKDFSIEVPYNNNFPQAFEIIYEKAKEAAMVNQTLLNQFLETTRVLCEKFDLHPEMFRKKKLKPNSTGGFWNWFKGFLGI